MGSDVIIRIHSKDTFTNNDTILGTVTLRTDTSVSLTHIQVKLEGVATSELKVPVQVPGKRQAKERLFQDVHKVLYDSQVVFPPENVRQVSQSQEFTLTPGEYTYPFLFRIPSHTSCVELGGITNKVSFNKKSFDLVMNNGGFSTNKLLNMGKSYLRQATEGQPAPPPPPKANYHVQGPLPPSFSNGTFANVKYFIKVTCKRSSFIQANIRATDGFEFVPTAPPTPESARERFFRKDVVFRAPRPASFTFEARAKHPAVLTPGSRPYLRLFVGGPGGSTIFLQHLILQVQAITTISVIEDDGVRREVHEARHLDVIPFFNETINKPVQMGSSPVEVPAEWFGSVVPYGLTPSFHTCNISRRYQLTVTAGFSLQPVDMNNDAQRQNVVYVDLTCTDVVVEPKISPSVNPPTLPQREKPAQATPHAAASCENVPPLPNRPTPTLEYDDHNANGQLPSYDEAVQEGLNQH